MRQSLKIPEQSSKPLSHRQQSVVDVLIKRGEKYSTRVYVATELDLTLHQVSNAITQAQIKGWHIESRHQPNSIIKEYRVDGDAPVQGFSIASQSQKQTIQRLIVEMNQIRIKAKETNAIIIEKMARRSMVAAGLQVE